MPGQQGMGGGGAGTPSQFASEYREQQQAAQALQRDLQRQGQDTKGLDQAIQQMQQLGTPGAYGKPGAAERASSLIQGLKEWEFELRKQLVADNASRPVLGGTDDIPPDYQALVSQYYQSLAKKP